MESTDAAFDRRRVALWMWRELRIGLPIGLISASFISVVFNNPFGRTLIYSLCIGLSIQLLIEAGRYGLSAWMRRRNPHNPALSAHWPGWTWMLPWSMGAAIVGYYCG
jgi:hypothetical protein